MENAECYLEDNLLILSFNTHKQMVGKRICVKNFLIRGRLFGFLYFFNVSYNNLSFCHHFKNESC